MKEPEILCQQIEQAPYEIPYEEELHIDGPRKVTWKKLIVDGDQGFVSIEEDYDAAQIYADGHLAADNYYYGMPWRVPAELLAGKENISVVTVQQQFFSEHRDRGM